MTHIGLIISLVASCAASILGLLAIILQAYLKTAIETRVIEKSNERLETLKRDFEQQLETVRADLEFLNHCRRQVFTERRAALGELMSLAYHCRVISRDIISNEKRRNASSASRELQSAVATYESSYATNQHTLLLLPARQQRRFHRLKNRLRTMADVHLTWVNCDDVGMRERMLDSLQRLFRLVDSEYRRIVKDIRSDVREDTLR